MADEVIALEDKADGVVPVGVPIPVVKILCGAAANQQIAAGVLVQPTDDIQKRRLAAAQMCIRDRIYTVLAETKPNQQEQLKFKREELRKYFPSGYTEEQMRRDIIKGLELLKRQRERNRDAR